jgi:hypothetical protein
MDFKHDESWHNLTTILASKTTANDAWDNFINFHEQITSKSYWTTLRHLDIEADQTEIVAWLRQLLTDNPVPKTIVAIWIGILKFADNNKEIPTIYFSGADIYDKDDIDWACDPAYLPEKRYAQPGVLQQIDDIVRADEENYEFFDWILPLAYCAFTFDEIFRTKVDRNLILKSKNEIYVSVGHDSGDYIELTSLK